MVSSPTLAHYLDAVCTGGSSPPVLTETSCKKVFCPLLCMLLSLSYHASHLVDSTQCIQVLTGQSLGAGSGPLRSMHT